MEINPGTGGGSGSSLTVTDGITPVVNVTTIDFTSGVTVTNGGGGQANVAVSSGAFAIQVPTGTINGTNKTFVFGTAPQMIVVDNATIMNKTNKAPDSTANWTGTTTVVLNVAPTFNIFGA